MVKNPLTMWETWVWSLGWEDPLEKGIGYPLHYAGLENSMDCVVHGVSMATTPVFLPEESPWSLVGYSPWDHKQLDMMEQISLSLSRNEFTKREKGLWTGNLLFIYFFFFFGFLANSVEKNLPSNEGDTSLIWVGKILWRRKWQPNPIFLPG